jgi:hypothetical protein
MGWVISLSNVKGQIPPYFPMLGRGYRSGS